MATKVLRISMPLRDWLFIDAEMDSSAQNAIEVDHHQVATKADAIRQIGWNATRHITRPISEAGRWPPGDDVTSEQVTVALATPDWRFVVERLLLGATVAETVGHSTEAAWGRALADRIAEYVAARSTIMGPHEDWWDVDEESPVVAPDSVVGQGARIVGGVTVGPCSYVAAGAVITKDVPPRHVALNVNEIVPATAWPGRRLASLVASWTAPPHPEPPPSP